MKYFENKIGNIFKVNGCLGDYREIDTGAVCFYEYKKQVYIDSSYFIAIEILEVSKEDIFLDMDIYLNDQIKGSVYSINLIGALNEYRFVIFLKDDDSIQAFRNELLNIIKNK